MNEWLRRIRGAIGMGLTWAVAWFGAGMILLLAGLILTGENPADVPFPLAFGMFGFIAGAAFSGILGIAEGRRRFDEMSLPRFAAWGGVGGLMLSVLFVSVVALAGDTTPLEHLGLLGPVFGLAGAGSATGTLALARKAENRELLDAGADVAEAGLTEDEAEELL